MTPSPSAAAATAGSGRRWVQQRVLLVLLLAAVAAAANLAFLTVAPNRLLSGSGVGLADAVRHLPAAWFSGGLALAAVLGAAVLLPASRRWHAAVALCAALLLTGLVALAGAEATRRAASLPTIARVSFGGGFWWLVGLAWLMAADALQRLQLRPAYRTAAMAALLMPVAVLLAAGALNDLSLLKEYANRQDVFGAAAAQHLQIVGTTLLLAVLIGLPLGLWAARRPGAARPLFAVLNLVQTVPSIALFALLLAPLAWLAQALPGLPVRGIGLLPAVIALTLYALLPIVHGVVAGLAQVPPAVVEAATGMGLTAGQRLRQVELPLALPVWLSGLRVTVVQVIGLAVVAALIGAGGFGALMFQGLFSSAIDLVLLGVLPVVALALAADAGLSLLAAAFEGPGR